MELWSFHLFSLLFAKWLILHCADPSDWHDIQVVPIDNSYQSGPALLGVILS